MSKVVYIQWEDSRIITCGWQHREFAKELEIYPCHSVGIIIGETKRHIILAPNWYEDKTSQEIAIPKSCITKMKVIKEVKD